MHWISLIAAGLCEMLGVILMNQFQKKRKSSGFFSLSPDLRLLFPAFLCDGDDRDGHYAIWTGIGTAGGALAGILFYGEQKDAKRIFSLRLFYALP